MRAKKRSFSFFFWVSWLHVYMFIGLTHSFMQARARAHTHTCFGFVAHESASDKSASAAGVCFPRNCSRRRSLYINININIASNRRCLSPLAPTTNYTTNNHHNKN